MKFFQRILPIFLCASMFFSFSANAFALDTTSTLTPKPIDIYEIDEGEIGYSDSEAYYRSFRSQADDAYEAYMES